MVPSTSTEARSQLQGGSPAGANPVSLTSTIAVGLGNGDRLQPAWPGAAVSLLPSRNLQSGNYSKSAAEEK